MMKFLSVVVVFFVGISLFGAPVLADDDHGPQVCHVGTVHGIDTAVGCIPTETETALAIFVLNWAAGVGGGVALVIIGIAGIQMATSAGDPAKVQGAKSLLTAAISGLLMIIFAAFLLRFIGKDILRLFT